MKETNTKSRGVLFLLVGCLFKLLRHNVLSVYAAFGK